MNHRVMITGVGVVSAFGLTTDEFWQGISSGSCAIKPLPPLDGIKMSVGATLPDYPNSCIETRILHKLLIPQEKKK